MPPSQHDLPVAAAMPDPAPTCYGWTLAWWKAPEIAMLGDDDDLTVLCPRCRNKTARPVGWFKENLTFRCDHCPEKMRYDRDLLRLDIETAGHLPAAIAGAVTIVADA